MLSKTKREGFKPLILKYYEDFKEKEIPSKYILYSDEEIKDIELIPHIFDPFCYESFHSVLYANAIIRETCCNYTIAIRKANDNKKYKCSILKGSECSYILYEIPTKAFLRGLYFTKCGNEEILIATKEKAVLDYIYVALFDFNKLTDFDVFFDLYRFDLEEFMLLDFDILKEIGKLYESPRMDLFLEYLDKGEFNFDC